MTKDDITTYLIKLAFNNDISVNFEAVHSYTPPATNVAKRRIFMNSNWRRPEEITFQLAHELGHIFCNHKNADILYFSPSKKGIELEANRYAINLLLPFYLSNKEPIYVSVEQFMESFSIPYHLENIVEQEIRKRVCNI